MARTLKSIPVRDRNGVKFKVFAREILESEPLDRAPRKFVRFELESGEPGKFLDQETFELSATGERFSRIRRERTPSAF